MIKISNLSKTIRRKVILDNINAELSGITGIIGPNGAGKTTLMEIIASVQKADSKSIITYNNNNRKVKIGYLPQNFNIYPNLTVGQVIELIASLKKAYHKVYIEQLIDQMNLELYRDVKLKKLSGGTLQRVGIVQALLNKPDYLIIDEPTTGLDIIEAIKLRESLLSLKDEVEIIISSHIPEDIASICDNLLVIKEGKKIYDGDINQLISKTSNTTYEGIINRSELNSANSMGRLVRVEPLDSNQVKVRLVTNNPLNNNCFHKVEADFLSGYINLLEGDYNV
ncbi:ABC transporter ATP-binding protein [Rummeliibacillus stabekisii]|uniref:ABC transporter ATP-binding protein n=1 Tax=Rummeliibacillus stabekisii TaxID=241244 RepID=UPI001167A008|nr:ATP-binding cassette domain-containing protein [Rummeliibacillus stabekisii]MBB5170436.1 ABC-2 type transport system ATP-binding protein [Rummeliibacillus stabekisii]GEL04691.1 ABC transporter ATP-binding protein [Rummeliibacillus stabekisii]